MRITSFTSMKVNVLSFIDTALDEAAAVCYDRPVNDARVTTVVVDLGHRSILRHGFASVKIAGISRSIGRQILRKAHADYVELSQRYVDMTNAGIIIPDDVLHSGDTAILAYKNACEDGVNNYIKLREEHGLLKEDARYVLPGAIETKIVMSGNLQMWWDFFNLRINKRVQKECRDIAKEILKQFGERSPLFRKHPKFLELKLH